jgi:hypothetical protein
VSKRFHLIVTDASPLITLAAADSLSCLTAPGIPLTIPDMVYFEAVRFPQKLGASELVDWMQQNAGLVRIEPTQVFAEFQKLLAVDPETKSRGRGEQAALEVLDQHALRRPGEETLLLFEDSDVTRKRFVLPQEAHPITTADLLDALQAAGVIPSAAAVLQNAVARGRSAGVSVRHADADVKRDLASDIEER